MAKRRISRRLIPLDEAVWHFAPTRLKDELERVGSLPSKPFSARQPEDRFEAFMIAMEGLRTVSDEMRVRQEPIWQMQKYLLQRLVHEKLEAFGIMIKPELGRTPQRIPAFIFKDQPKVQWRKNVVENFGQRFEGVEVRRYSAADEPSRPREKTPIIKSAGRPRVDESIREVILELREQDAFRGKLKKEKVAVVQDRAQIRYPNLFPKKSQPSPTKIRHILKLEGE